MLRLDSIRYLRNKRKTYDKIDSPFLKHARRESPLTVIEHDYLDKVIEKKSELITLIQNEPAFDQDDKTIFVDNEESKTISSGFMQSFWSDENNIRTTVDFHQFKLTKTNGSSASPSCLTFTVGELRGNLSTAKICFLTMSGEMNSQIKPILRHHAHYINSQQTNIFYWVPSLTNITGYNMLLSTFMPAFINTKKVCSEKFQLGILSYIYHYCDKYHYQFKVTSSTNISFYPYSMPNALYNSLSTDAESLHLLLNEYSAKNLQYNGVFFNKKYKSAAILVKDIQIKNHRTDDQVFLLSLVCCQSCKDLLLYYRLLMMAAKAGLLPAELMQDSEQLLELSEKFAIFLPSRNEVILDDNKIEYLDTGMHCHKTTEKTVINYRHPSNPYPNTIDVSTDIQSVSTPRRSCPIVTKSSKRNLDEIKGDTPFWKKQKINPKEVINMNTSLLPVGAKVPIINYKA